MKLLLPPLDFTTTMMFTKLYKEYQDARVARAHIKAVAANQPLREQVRTAGSSGSGFGVYKAVSMGTNDAYKLAAKGYKAVAPNLKKPLGKK